MTLALRRTVIAGDTLQDDYVVIHEGRAVGRIRKATEREGSRTAVWDWMVNVPLAIPPGCIGTADDREAAMQAFKAAWETFLQALTPAQIEHWHHIQDAADKR